MALGKSNTPLSLFQKKKSIYEWKLENSLERQRRIERRLRGKERNQTLIAITILKCWENKQSEQKLLIGIADCGQVLKE